MSKTSVTNAVNESVMHQPSETALGTAAMRAIATYDEREEIRGKDYLAELFLSEDRSVLLKDLVKRQWILKNNASPGVYEFMIARTAFFDHAVEEALCQGWPQLVFLGAGYDSRPYRFRDLAQATRIFELDAASTQGRKQAILERAGIPMPPQLVFVAIDFSTEDIAQVLIMHGFSKTERTLFVWEGVMYYLSAEAVDHTFAAVRSIAATGSEICFDYAALSREAMDEDRTKKLREHMKTQHANEPTRFGIPVGTLPQFLTERGYQLIQNENASEMETKFLALRDGSIAGKVPELFSLARAKISD